MKMRLFVTDISASIEPTSRRKKRHVAREISVSVEPMSKKTILLRTLLCPSGLRQEEKNALC